MTTLLWITGLIAAALGASLALFRKGGAYNPKDAPTPSATATESVTVSKTSENLPMETSSTTTQQPPQAPKRPVATTSPETDRQSRLDTFCTAIRDFEGKPGDANYVNNNPGNARYYQGGYLAKYGNVRCSPAGFAIFPTWEQGWEYLQVLVTQMAKKNPQWTFLDFFNVYAPESDNNPTKRYATFVAERCTQPVNSSVAKYLNLV